MRTDGRPSGPAVASAIASGSLTSDPRASASHSSNKAKGSVMLQPLRLGLAETATHLVSRQSVRHVRTMALDLYQRLGVKRGASEAEIKKAYRSLAKQLHPDRNKDNPNAAKRFGEVTHAYDLLSDKDKRAQYDRGEIDEDGNPKMPFGGGFGGYSSAGGPQPGAAGFENFNFGNADGADLSDLFEGLFGAASGGRQRGGGPFG